MPSPSDSGQQKEQDLLSDHYELLYDHADDTGISIIELRCFHEAAEKAGSLEWVRLINVWLEMWKKRTSTEEAHTDTENPCVPKTSRQSRDEPWNVGDRLVLLEALRRFECLARCDQNHTELGLANACHGRGWVLNEMGRYEEALDAFEEGIRAAPHLAYLHDSKGTSHTNCGRFNLALSAHTEAVRLRDSFALAWNHIGTCHLQNREMEEKALNAFDKAKLRRPDWPQPYFNAGWTHHKRKEYQEARNAFQKALDLTKRQVHDAAVDKLDPDLLELWLDRVRTGRLPNKNMPASLAADLFRSLEDKGIAHRRAQHDRAIEEAVTLPRRVGTSVDNSLFVLRDWNSYTPILPMRFRPKNELGPSHRRGGGYFLAWQGHGVVIDPGHNFISQLYDRGLSIADVDTVIVTHCHLDHTQDLDALVDLRHRRTKSGLEGTIKFFLSKGAAIKWKRYLIATGVCDGDPRELIPGPGLHQVTQHQNVATVLAVSAYHTTFGADSCGGGPFENETVGLVFQLNGRSPGAKSVSVGFTSDTEWKPSLASQFESCDVLIAHIGTAEPPPCFSGTRQYYRNHLGLKGCLRLMRNAKPSLLVLGEFGEELLEMRGEVLRVFHEARRKNTTIAVLAGDSNLAVSLDAARDLSVFCSHPDCNPDQRPITRIPLKEVRPVFGEDRLFRYYCAQHWPLGES